MKEWLTCQEEEHKDHDEGVAKVEESVDEAVHVHLRDIVVDAV